MYREMKTIKGAVANGTLLSAPLDVNVERRYVSLVFLDANGLPVTPTAGTVKVSASETGLQWGVLATVDATKAGVNSTYERLLVQNSVAQMKVELTGVTGASTIEVRLAGFE